MSKTSIIIPVYKNASWTKVCLDSLYSNTDMDQTQIIIINNGNDQNINDLCADYSPITLCSFEKNMGSYYSWNYAVNNKDCGLVEEDSEFLCFMHNDVVVSKNWLEKLKKHLDSCPEVAVCSPCSNYVDENEYLFSKELMELYIQYKKNNKERINIEDINKLFSNTYRIKDISEFNDFVLRINALNRNESHKYTTNISTFCCLMRRETFDKFGPFDDDFYPHLYSEKLMKKKISLDGMRTSCLYDVFVHHNGNTTTDGIEFVYNDMATKNRTLYNDKLEEYESEILSI